MWAYWTSRDGAVSALKIVGIGIVVFFILTLGVFAFFRKDLPNITDISGGNLGGSISYYDRTGQHLLWQDYDAVKRVPVQGTEMAQVIKDATIATEDRNFYNEKGFAIRSIVRAAFNNAFNRGSTQGGSTITQQLVKLTQDWTQNRSLARKVKELILAVELERSYTKDQILTGYLNVAPYGGVDYGVQAAASDYFHKSAKDLNLAEAAMLAAIPKSPAVYSPYSPDFDKKLFQGRYGYVLDSMVETGKIKKDQAETAKKVDVIANVHPRQTKYAGIRAPYFVLAAKAELSKRFLPTSSNSSTKVGGWRVTTTVDMTLQDKAEQLVQSNLSNIRRFGADSSALVLEDVKTGQMMALVGGTDFNNEEYGKINYAQWYISPGSSFKPYDYVALIENSNNAGAGSVLYDTKSKLPNYPCTREGQPPPRGNSDCLYDYDFRFPGPLTLRYALGGSRNIPAVKAMLTVVPGKTTDSINKTITTANALMNAPGAYKCFTPGVDVNTATAKDETQCYEASSIGDGAYMHLDQHVNGLASLGRMGQAIPQTYIMQINDSANKAIYKWQQPKGNQVVRPDAAYILNDIASDPNASYLPIKWHRYNGWNTAIKTGTTNNGFDGLMMAWNTQYAVGSWVGFHTRNKTLSTFMENLTTPLTRGMMTFALDNSKAKAVNWTAPSSIQRLPAYVVRTHVGVSSVEPSPSTDIYPSWYKPRGTSSQSQTIDRVSGKIATDCTPPAAKQTLSGSAAPETFSVDIFTGAGGAANTGSSTTDDIHNCGDTKPSISSFSVTSIGNNQYQLSATAAVGTHALTGGQYGGTISFTIDGQPINGCANSCTASMDGNGNLTMNFTNSAYNGSYSIVATVTDTVLYQNSSTWSGSLSTSSSSSIVFSSATVDDDKTKFNWSGGNGPYTVYKSGGTPVGSDCTAKNSSNCSVDKDQAPAGSQVYVQDSGGNKSNTVTVSGS